MPAFQLTRQGSLSQQLKHRKFRTSISLRVVKIFKLSTLSTHRVMDKEAALLKTTDSVQPTLAPAWEVAAKVCAQGLVLAVLLSSGKVGMVETALAAKTGQGLLSSKTNRKGTLHNMVLSHPSQTNMEVSTEEPRTSLQVHTEACNRHSITDSPPRD